MTEAKHRKWDIITNVITALLTVIGIFIGVVKFNTQQKENETLEFRREMWKIKSQSYSQVCEAAGTLASNFSSDTAFIHARERFESFYWGTLVINSDDGVNAAMLEIHTTLQNINREDSNFYIRLPIQVSNLVDSCNRSLVIHWEDINS